MTTAELLQAHLPNGVSRIWLLCLGVALSAAAWLDHRLPIQPQAAPVPPVAVPANAEHTRVQPTAQQAQTTPALKPRV